MAFLVRLDGTRVDLGYIGLSDEQGMRVNGVEHRCGRHSDGVWCELPVGHEGPVMPRWRHVGRDSSGVWQTWEYQH